MSESEPVRKSLLRRLLFPFLIILLLIGTGLGGYWVLKKFKGRQSRQLTKLALDYLQKNKVSEAEMSLETAARLQPKNSEALRMLARLQGSTGQGAKALETWQKLISSGGATLDDLAQYSMLASREGDQALAERLADAAATGGNTVLKHILRANIFLSKNDPSAAEDEFRQAVAVDQTGKSRILLARFLLSRRLDSQSISEVRELLREISKQPDASGLEALTTAITRSLIPPGELPAWVSALRGHPAADAKALLLADATDIQLHPEAKPAVLAKMLDRMKSAPAADRALGVSFLLMAGEPASASGLMTRDEAIKNGPTFTLWLDAQSLNKNWPAVLDALSQPGLPLSPHMTKLYRGRALIMSGKEEEGRAAYAEALRDTMDSKSSILETLAYLNLAGEDRLFEEGLQKTLSDSATAKDSFLRILPSVAMRRDAARTLRAYEIAAAVSPELAKDLTLQNDMAHLSLLLGRPVDVKKIAFLTDANPRDFSLRTTHALALLKAGKNKEALVHLESCEPDVAVETLPPHHKVIIAAALAANGRRQEALGVASILPPQQLSIQEIEFLRSYLAEPNSTPTPTPQPKKKEASKKK